MGPRQAEAVRRWIERLLAPEDGPVRSQVQLSKILGVSQPLISDLLRRKQTPTMGTVRVMVDHAKKRLGPDHDYEGIMRGSLYVVGLYEGRDPMLQARGQALDILAAAYDQEFLELVQAQDGPPGSEGWSVEQWIEHIVQLRKLYRSASLSPATTATRRLASVKK